MRLMKRRKYLYVDDQDGLDDPISGVANLFDASVVMIVSMIIALFTAYHMMEFLDPSAEVTVTKKKADGTIEIISKKGKEIKVTRATTQQLSGAGTRLGTAYQLGNGRVVYVPE